MEQLQTLVETLEAQNEVKKDYVASPANLIMNDGNLVITRDNVEVSYKPSDLFYQQIGTAYRIPKEYADRCRAKENIALFDANVNHWLKKDANAHLVRTFDNGDKTARAYLSKHYNIIDNYEVLFETLQAIRETGIDIEIKSASLSETSMYLKVICPAVHTEARQLLYRYAKTAGVGYEVISGFEIVNSEVGKRRFRLLPLGHVVACSNGLVLEKEGLSKTHLGAELNEMDFYKNKNVVSANKKLVSEQVKHAVQKFLSHEFLESLVRQFTELGDKEIEAPIANVIEVVSNQYQIGDARKNNILNYFIKGADTRRIGLVNAITEELQTLDDADVKHDSELIPMNMLTNFDKIERDAITTKFSAS